MIKDDIKDNIITVERILLNYFPISKGKTWHNRETTN